MWKNTLQRLFSTLLLALSLAFTLSPLAVKADPENWTSFTPTYSGLTVGSGTNLGYYYHLGKQVCVKTNWTYGSGSAVSAGNPSLTLPVNSASTGYTDAVSVVGQGAISDASVGNYYTRVRWRNTTTVDFIVLNVSGTYASASGLSTTSPMTWTTGDQLTSQFCYESASFDTIASAGGSAGVTERDAQIMAFGLSTLASYSIVKQFRWRGKA